jgi:hypothetical protein
MLLVLVALGAGALESSSLPHVHAAPEAGLWNLDHDLVSLATLGHAAPLADGLLAPRLIPVASAVATVETSPVAGPFRGADPRGPPTVPA